MNAKYWIGLAQAFHVLILPMLYLFAMDIDLQNDCCGDTATFSPPHRAGIYILIIACMFSYLYCTMRDDIATPIVEVILNSFLIIGIVLNILLLIHIGQWLSLVGNIPIILLFILQLAENQVLLKNHLLELDYATCTPFEKSCYTILKFHPFIKFPILLILCLPILILISLFLTLFGQKPDAMIQAFTQTYKHGFSELDHLCATVCCDGHYLCTVGAKGHKSIVKPVRIGIRNGEKIVCNRQLLIANAFEEVIQQKMPKVHKLIRKNYDHVGNAVEQYYSVFRIKWVSDLVYLLMKPLEWIFLLVLYTVDKKPENRIERQYRS